MIVAEYRVKFRQRVKALLGGQAGFDQFFRRHPYTPSMWRYARAARQQRIDPLSAARDWFTYKVAPQLGCDSANAAAQTGDRQKLF